MYVPAFDAMVPTTCGWLLELFDTSFHPGTDNRNLTLYLFQNRRDIICHPADTVKKGNRSTRNNGEYENERLMRFQGAYESY